MDPQQRALCSLGQTLRAAGYRFVTVTPETHDRVRRRATGGGERGEGTGWQARRGSLRDVFGWNKPFAIDALEPPVVDLLEAAGALRQENGLLRSTVRFASLGTDLLVHSAFPTTAPDSVFFGPDTYRFCALLDRCVPDGARLVDVGAGSGAGGLYVRARARKITLADVNPEALRFARVNAALGGASCRVLRSDVLGQVDDDFDVVVANPPYMNDDAERAYRDGGGAFGEALSARIVEESIERLPSGGRLVLYTGAAVVDGTDVLWDRIAGLVERGFSTHTYQELDPDVFGEELERPAYAAVERIAAVALVATR